MRRRDVQRPLSDLNGLILAGGRSMRMGMDKGTIEYCGRPHARHLHDLLAHFCGRVFVSISPAQRDREPYASIPAIVDSTRRQGPASGLLYAALSDRDSAWLVVAVDLALLDNQTLKALVAGRRQSAAATAFEHTDGTLEPLCAIWEPVASAALAQRVAAGDASPRRCLEALDVEILTCREPNALRSIDSPADRDAVLRQLQRSP